VAERHEDDLFRPTLAGTRARAGTGDRPWRVSSQFFVAFFGGPLAAAVVGILNGRRLGLGPVRLLGMAAAGVAAYAVALGAGVVISGLTQRGARLTLVVGGVLTYLVTRRLQEDADRRYAAGLGFDDTYASLWLTGLLIVVGVGLPSGLLLVGVIGE
jgi:hypothetical protein